jgi:hypothetical protein
MVTGAVCLFAQSSPKTDTWIRKYVNTCTQIGQSIDQLISERGSSERAQRMASSAQRQLNDLSIEAQQIVNNGEPWTQEHTNKMQAAQERLKKKMARLLEYMDNL